MPEPTTGTRATIIIPDDLASTINLIRSVTGESIVGMTARALREWAATEVASEAFRARYKAQQDERAAMATRLGL